MQARIESSGPSKCTSCTSAVRRRSASAAGLSLDASAVISVMPAARASPSSSAASAEPIPRCWYSSATAKAISALARSCGRVSRSRSARVAVDVRDERVVRPVDRRELLELGVGEAGLRAVEARPAGCVPEALEDGADGPGVAVLERAHEERGAVAEGEDAGVHESVGKTYRSELEKSTHLWHTVVTWFRAPAPSRRPSP